MSKPKQIVVTTKVIRHHPQLSRLVTIPLDVIAPWKLDATTVVEATINEIDLGRRSLKRWDDRQCWWIDLPGPLCKKAGIDEGDEVTLKISLASEDLPEELSSLLQKSQLARERWDALTRNQQRMLREMIIEAKTSATRTRRATRLLNQSFG
jgi:hypothetical protein